MPLASKIACAITLGVFALNITSGLALSVPSGIGQTANVVGRDPDFTLTRTMTLVSRTDGSSSANLEGLCRELLEAKSEKDKNRLKVEMLSKIPHEMDPAHRNLLLLLQEARSVQTQLEYVGLPSGEKKDVMDTMDRIIEKVEKALQSPKRGQGS